MKIIKRLKSISFFLISSIFLIPLINCSKNKIVKKDFIGYRGSIKKERLQVIKSHKWKLKRVYIYNNTDFVVEANDRIRFENIENKILEFRENGIYINDKFVGGGCCCLQRGNIYNK